MYVKHQRHLPTTFKETSHSKDAPTDNSQTSLSLPWISWVLQEIFKEFAKIAKLLALLTQQQVEFKWTPGHHEAFLKLKESIIQGQIL